MDNKIINNKKSYSIFLSNFHVFKSMKKVEINSFSEPKDSRSKKII